MCSIAIVLVCLLGWSSWTNAQADGSIPLEIQCFDPIACALYDPTTGQSQPTQNATDDQAVDASPDQMYTQTEIKYDGLQCNFVKAVDLRGQRVVLPLWFKSPGVGILMVPVLKPNQTWNPATPIPPPQGGQTTYPKLAVDPSGTHLVDNPPCTAQNAAPAANDTYSQWTYTEQQQNLPGLECNSVTSTSLKSGPTVLPVWLKKGSTGIGLISVPNEPDTAKWGDPPIPIKPPSGDYQPLDASCGTIKGQDPPCSNPNAPNLSTNWTPVKSDMQLPPGQNGKIHTTVNCVELDLPVYNDNGSALIMVPPVVFGAIVVGANLPDIIAATLPAGLTPLEIAADGSVEPSSPDPKQNSEPDAGNPSATIPPISFSSTSSTSSATSLSASASASASANNETVLGTVDVKYSLDISVIKAASSPGTANSKLISANVPAIVHAVSLDSPALGGICHGRCLAAAGGGANGNVSKNALDETVAIAGGSSNDAGSTPVQGKSESQPGQSSPSPSPVYAFNPFGNGGSGTDKRSWRHRRRKRAS